NKPYQLERGVERRPTGQRARVGTLLCGAVGQRIRERDADLESIGAGIERRFGQRVTGGDVGKAGGQVREQAAAAFALEAREGLAEAAAHARYSWWPDAMATV